MRWNDDERRAGVQAVAVQRAAAVPVFLGVALLQDDVETAWALALGVIALLANGVTAVWLLGARWRSAPLPGLLALDSIAIAVAVALTGGADSDVRFLFIATIVATAVCLPQRMILVIDGLVIVLTGLVVVLMPGEESPITFFLAAALATILATTVAWVGEQNAARLSRLADERRTLLADALDAEQTTRRVLAQEVHDRVLQTLLAARQDLEEAAADAPGALGAGRSGVDAAIAGVRDAVHELHAGALAGKLPGALRALADRTTQTTGIDTRSDVQAGPTRHDELLYAVARQLVLAAAAREGATTLELALRRDGADVVLEVTDDGRPDHRAAEPRLGFATSAARIAEAGGVLRVEVGTGGTKVSARLPDAAG